MKHVYDLSGVAPGAARVAFGAFDGMHLGHQAVIRQLCGSEGQTAVVVSFSEEADSVIYTESEKEYLLSGMGVEIMVSLPWAAVDAMTAEEFAREILAGKLQAKSVVAGGNLRFGSDRQDIETLKDLGEELGFEVEVVATVCSGKKPVCGGDIREAIEAGDFNRMSTLLGHTYIMQGTVVHGKAAGRRHGMPTANLAVAENKLYPPHGVYATLSHMDGVSFPGVTNIGLRPSDDDIPIPTVETWLLDFSGDIYGRRITLEVCAYIRGIMKFRSLDEVREQIDRDVLTAQSLVEDFAAKKRD